MDININETVTISLQTFKAMEKEIEDLKKEVAKKTIVVKQEPTVYGTIYRAMLLAFLIWLLFHFTKPLIP